jgi:hypothetical protein
VNEERMIVVRAGPASRSLAQRLVAGLWVLAAMGAVALVLALGLAVALLLIPVVMIAAMVIWLRLRLRAPSGRRNVRVIRH